MTQEKEILLKDLCARLPYHPIVHIHDIDVIDYDNYLYPDYIEKMMSYSITLKPYLRSMSSMTDKEKKDLLNYVVGKGSKYFEVCDDVSITDKSSDEQDVKSFELKWINFNPNTTSRYIEWLLKNHFDFCNLIQRGLALTAPDGMYKI